MFVSLTRVCVVYVVKEVTSFPGAEPIKKHAGNSLSSAKSCSNGNLCVHQLFTFVHTPGSLRMSSASMENKKAKRAPCKRVRENENLDSIESTSGLVQQHASGSCSPKITNSETVQLPLHNPDDSCSSSNNGGQEHLMMRRDRERLRRQNETEEQRSIQLNKQRVLNHRRRQTESLQARAIRLERMRQRASTRNSVETEEQRSSHLTDA